LRWLHGEPNAHVERPIDQRQPRHDERQTTHLESGECFTPSRFNACAEIQTSKSRADGRLGERTSRVENHPYQSRWGAVDPVKYHPHSSPVSQIAYKRDGKAARASKTIKVI